MRGDTGCCSSTVLGTESGRMRTSTPVDALRSRNTQRCWVPIFQVLPIEVRFLPHFCWVLTSGPLEALLVPPDGCAKQNTGKR